MPQVRAGRSGAASGLGVYRPDLRMAYDALTQWHKAPIEDLSVVHSALHSRFLLGDTAYNPGAE